MSKNLLENNPQSINRRAFKAGTWYIVSQILIRGMAFFTTPFFSRVLTASSFGDVKTVESLLYIISPALSLCIYESISRAKYDFGEEYDKYISSVQSISIISSIVAFLICLPFTGTVSNALNVSPAVLFVMFLYAFTHPSVLCMQNREKQLLKYKSNILISALLVVPSTLISIFLLLAFKNSGKNLADIRLLGLIAPQVIVGIIIVIMLYRSGKCFYNTKYWKYALTFCVPLVPYALASTILNQSDRVMVKYMISSENAGIFSLGVTLIYIIEVLSVAVSGAFEPWMFEKMNNDQCNDVRKIWKLIALGFAAMTFAMTLFAPEIVWILGGSEYKNAIYLIPPMLSGALMNFYCLVIIKIEYFHKKVKLVAVGTICSAVVNVILNYVFIKLFGSPVAASYTTAFCYLLLLIIHSAFVFKIESRKVVPLKFTLICAIAVSALNILTQLMYSDSMPSYFRYLVAFIFIAVSAVLFRQKIGTSLSVLKNIISPKK